MYNCYSKISAGDLGVVGRINTDGSQKHNQRLPPINPLCPPSRKDRDKPNHAYSLEHNSEVHKERRRAPHGAEVPVIGVGGERCAVLGAEGEARTTRIETELGGYYAGGLFPSQIGRLMNFRGDLTVCSL